MKKVTAFVGSARKKGLTSSAARQFLDRLQALGEVEGEVVFLSDYNVGLCRGCKVCFVRGEERCPLKDDRDKLIEKMRASDGVVFVTPNYSFHVSGATKVFLDRLGFVFHRPQFHGKAFTGIVAQGFFGGRKVVKYLDFVGLGMGFNVVKGSLILGGLDPLPETSRRKMDKVLDAHSRRFHARLMKAPYPAPSFMQLLMFRGGRQSSKYLGGDDNRDHVYYRDKGWFDSDYFYPVKLGPVKKAIGALIDRKAAKSAKAQAASMPKAQSE